MASEWVIAIFAGLVAGLVIGWMFFAGLLWTVRHLVSSRRPGLLIAASFVGRFLALGLSVALIAMVDARMILGFVPGLLTARAVATRPSIVAGSEQQVESRDGGL